MNPNKPNYIFTALFEFHWASTIAEHVENYFCEINQLWDCDFLPGQLKSALIGSEIGSEIRASLSGRERFNYSEDNIRIVQGYQFMPGGHLSREARPLYGRFYQLGYFTGLSGVFPQSIKPCRVIGLEESAQTIKIDTNVPISQFNLDLQVKILDITQKPGKMRGECRAWCDLALQDGPGMQTRHDSFPTDFEFQHRDTFGRQDESDDTIFYSKPRLTHHIDTQCHENLKTLYESLLGSNAAILDFMSSYESHIPEQKGHNIAGLGLNIQELNANSQLNSRIIHDIHKNPNLPFDNESFDAVVCDLSIEYVTRPFELISEIHRILKNNGIVTFSFSNRYFPEKVINIWVDLHEFERMGFILEMLLKELSQNNIYTL